MVIELINFLFSSISGMNQLSIWVILLVCRIQSQSSLFKIGLKFVIVTPIIVTGNSPRVCKSCLTDFLGLKFSLWLKKCVLVETISFLKWFRELFSVIEAFAQITQKFIQKQMKHWLLLIVYMTHLTSKS